MMDDRDTASTSEATGADKVKASPYLHDTYGEKFPSINVSKSFSTTCDAYHGYDGGNSSDSVSTLREEDSLSETERKLREAGVYFRLPPSASSRNKHCDTHINGAGRTVSKFAVEPPSKSSTLYSTSSSTTAMTPSRSNEASDIEVNEVLDSFDTTLADYSGGSSSNNSSGGRFAHGSGGPHSESPGGSSTRESMLAPADDERPSVRGAAQCYISAGRGNIGGSVNNTNKMAAVDENDGRRVQWGGIGGQKGCVENVFGASAQNRAEEGRSPSTVSVKCLSETYETKVKMPNLNGNSVVTICPYSERRRLGPFKLDRDQNNTVSTQSCSIEKHPNKVNVNKNCDNDLKNNYKNSLSTHSKESRDSVMEPFNLIEEVFVPESSVAMRAFFPGVEYAGRSSGVRTHGKVLESDRGERITQGRCGDSDSGHGSGAASPCGTLTDPPSPPPSPPDTRHQHLHLPSTNQTEPNPSFVSEQETTVKSQLDSSDLIVVSTTGAEDSRKHVSILNCSPMQLLSPKSPTPCTATPHSSGSPPRGPQELVLESAVLGHSQVSLGEVTVTSAQSKELNHFVVVAIDFGTTYSGYAFSFTRDTESVHMMKQWEGGDPGVQNQKTPTIVLLTPDRHFHSLGFSARDQYHDLDPKEAANWLYFDKFKMELHDDRSLSRDSLLTAANGVRVPALEIFSHALRFFRDHALRELGDLAGAPVAEEGVRWVLTVPAIWSHPAKQFMRTAAYMAGLGSTDHPEQLLIALEPEAAAIYCRRLHRHQLVPSRPAVLRAHTSTPPSIITSRPVSSPSGTFPKYSHFKVPDEVGGLGMSHSTLDVTTLKEPGFRLPRGVEGAQNSVTIEQDDDTAMPLVSDETVSDWLVQDTVYMVVDCGGGTVDITVHQMTDTNAGHLKELHKATGGPYGSTGVDKEFEKLLDKIFTPEFMTVFKQQRPAAFVDLMIAFESRKRNASLQRSNPLNIALPFSFIDMFKKTKGKDVETAVRKRGQALGVQWSAQGMLRLSQDTMRGLFRDTLASIQQSIDSVLSLLEREASTGNSTALQYLFLVGGFSESELLQQHIRDAFSHIVTVVIPQGMGLAILRGAVQFGLDPSVVTVRRSRLTYGVGVLNRYQEGVHPQEKRVFAAGACWCADVLDVFVRVDESVAVGDVVSRSYTPATKGQATVVLHLYATSESRAMHFVSDPGVKRVGTLRLDLSNNTLTAQACPATASHTADTPDPAGQQHSDSQNEEGCSKDAPDSVRCDGSSGPDGLCSCNASSSCCSKCSCCSGGGGLQSCAALEPRREISVHLKFGDTEVKASAVDHCTGKCVKANFDFHSL